MDTTRMMRGTLRFFLLTLFLLPPRSQAKNANEALARATAAVQAAVLRAEADPARPIFHVMAAAQWMNDPNGPIYYKGYYHLFYQLHPFSDKDGTKYWGHVRSRDLVKWQHLPIALWPSTDAGEAGVWSGCCTINGLGQPMIFYTSVKVGKSPMEYSEQWAAVSDDDLIRWHKLPANPVLAEELNGKQKIYDWRDPFIFHDHQRTFMVIGGNLNKEKGGQAVVAIYEAENRGLTKWKYRGVLFHVPDAPTAECPNFFQLNNQWVLFVSPYSHPRYFVGDFDLAMCRFHARTQGVLDYGSFYAPNTMQVPDGRRLVWGWINGFPGGHGWNGCLSLPRQLSLSRDGQLQQEPVPQLRRLRGKMIEWRNVPLKKSGESLQLPETNTLEIRAHIDLETAHTVALEFKSGTKAAQPITVGFGGSELQVMATKAPLQITRAGSTLSLRVFIDRSVLEVFANNTVCVTKVIHPLDANSTLEIRAEGGRANAKRIEAWPMKTIW